MLNVNRCFSGIMANFSGFSSRCCKSGVALFSLCLFEKVDVGENGVRHDYILWHFFLALEIKFDP